jgi:alkylhydroperoxidase family enzyme
MAWIETVDPAGATGLLKQIYDEGVQRAGKVFQILRIQSLRPRVLNACIKLYLELMHAPRGALSRARREMIATTVSSINHCHY